jgi:hypothetical protein
MIENQHVTEIDGSADRVWDTLTDLQQYPKWNPVIHRVTGDLIIDADIHIFVGPTDRRWDVTVVRIDTGRELAWKFHERSPRLFRGVHTFRLEQLGAIRTRFVDHESFHGLLVPFRAAQLRRQITGMVSMGAALKQRVETSAADHR